MNLEQLQKGFFGYKKSSVYQYIMTMEEEFSDQLIKKDEQRKTEAEQYQERIRQLEKELAETKKQMETQKKEQDMIAFTMIEAKRYAESLRKETEEKEKKRQDMWNEKVREKEKELDEYGMKIKQVRILFERLLHEMDDQTQKIEQQVKDTKGACPIRNVSLFEKKKA